jgi:hypothetical protein
VEEPASAFLSITLKTCHPDRSVAQWSDLRLFLPLLVPFACCCFCLFLLSEAHGFSRGKKKGL